MNSKLRLLKILVACLALIQAGEASAQINHVPSKERGDVRFRRKTNIDGNLVRTTVFNYAFYGRTGAGATEVVGFPFEWPKNTRRHYVALASIFLGAETVDKTGNTIRVVDLPTFRSSPSGVSWNLQPVPGYLNANSQKIAISDDQSSWPSFWPDKLDDKDDPGWRGSWNGFFGKNQFNADQEIFFRDSDDNYDRFNFFPDSTDLSRRGLGFIVDVRVLEWSQILINDVVFTLHEIKNDGTTDYRKVAFTLWLADLVGGDGDSSDDTPQFDLLTDVAFSLDRDGRGNNAFGTDPVGAAGTAFLETPGNAIDGIDNDGDGEENSPKISEQMLAGEDATDQIDNNGNGLIDENLTHVPFGAQAGVGFRDRIDNNGNAEAGSPVLTQAMLFGETNLNGFDDNGNGLYDEGVEDLNHAFADGIDNDDDGEDNSPIISQATLQGETANNGRDDNGNGLIDEGPEDIGKKYADGKDNDGDGAIDEDIDEGIDEMIDESRDDFIDNDGDWDPLRDDVGLDGDPLSKDPGTNDGKPTSGAGTPFPGEPNIDKTDVAESDQLGLTNVQYLAAGAINFNQTPDDFFWFRMMVPGDFNIVDVLGDFDLFVSSGFFPLEAGRTERISMAIILGENKTDVLTNKDRAQLTYDSDYQFAQAPLPPNVRAVPGDNKVTLYWDTIAERSFDRFFSRLGEPAFDFEGYRIYRSTDPGFQDVPRVTRPDGVGTFLVPIAQFDKIDVWQGLHPIQVLGASFDLGNNTGVVQTWTDTTVQNGQTYYYAVASYDFGNVRFNIPPAESTTRISTIEGTNDVETGPNVVVVTPNPPAAGYVPPTLGNIDLIAGSTTANVSYKIIDQRTIQDGHIYRITFEDTLKKAATPTENDTLTTKNFSLFDVTRAENPIAIFDKRPIPGADEELPIVDGFQLFFANEERVFLDRQKSKWSREAVHDFDLRVFTFFFTKGTSQPSDYRITVGDVGLATSTALQLDFGPFLPAKPVNFKIENVSKKQDIEFAFWELDGNDGRFSANSRETDIVIFLERDDQNTPVITWELRLTFVASRENPGAGDVLDVFLIKPFLSQDVFQFTAKAGAIDRDRAGNELDGIKVVPNPYRVAATWEPKNPFNSGRGPQQIHFNHLPNKCTIRIFTVSGELVATIEHDTLIDDGTAVWDLLTRDKLAVSYGVYIYQVSAPDIGEKIGKFAVIK
ncbi:hypothetical protein L0337_02830 [candidate division KSB1 bacterium]|nr:hypothetical protein [candidate division KSB1 bacterium]